MRAYTHIYYQMRFAVTEALGKAEIDHVNLCTGQVTNAHKYTLHLTEGFLVLVLLVLLLQFRTTVQHINIRSSHKYFTSSRHLVSTLSKSHHEIIGLNVTMKKVAGMQIFDSTDLLVREGEENSKQMGVKKAGYARKHAKHWSGFQIGKRKKTCSTIGEVWKAKKKITPSLEKQKENENISFMYFSCALCNIFFPLQ